MSTKIVKGGLRSDLALLLSRVIFVVQQLWKATLSFGCLLLTYYIAAVYIAVFFSAVF
jgi:hypothetical protein